MCLNAGESPDIIVFDVEKQEKNFGYDFSQHKNGYLVERGVIDPARVTRCAFTEFCVRCRALLSLQTLRLLKFDTTYKVSTGGLMKWVTRQLAQKMRLLGQR